MPIIKKELAQKNFTVHKNLCPRNAANRATNIVASCLYLVRGTTNIKNHKLINGVSSSVTCSLNKIQEQIFLEANIIYFATKAEIVWAETEDYEIYKKYGTGHWEQS